MSDRIFQTPAPEKAVRNGGSVTPMSGLDKKQPVNFDPPGSIQHAPNADIGTRGN